MAVMEPGRPRLGAHLPLAAGMVRAADRAHEIGADAIQIFSDNPAAWRRRAAPPPEREAFRARLAKHDIAPIAVHGAYLINLAGPADDLFDRSVTLLAAELVAAAGVGARFVNIHSGSHRDTSLEEGIARIGLGVALALERVTDTADDVKVVLENSVGGGWAMGSTIEDMARIGAAIEARGVSTDRVAFCLDTSHLWGAGRRISEPDEVDRVVAEFDALIGLPRLALVHLNDARMALGSHRDRHEHIGEGRIGARGLGHLLRHRDLRQATFILETPGMTDGFDAVNVARARSLLRGEEPADLAHVADADAAVGIAR